MLGGDPLVRFSFDVPLNGYTASFDFALDSRQGAKESPASRKWPPELQAASPQDPDCYPQITQDTHGFVQKGQLTNSKVVLQGSVHFHGIAGGRVRCYEQLI